MRGDTDICDECGETIIAKYIDAGLCPDCAEKRVECEVCGITFTLIDGEGGKDKDVFQVYLCAKCAIGESVECDRNGRELVYCGAYGACVPKREAVKFADLGWLCAGCASEARRLQAVCR